MDDYTIVDLEMDAGDIYNAIIEKLKSMCLNVNVIEQDVVELLIASTVTEMSDDENDFEESDE